METGSAENAVKGNWDFRFAADGADLASATRHLPLDVSFKLPNGAAIQLTEYTGNPLGDKIYFDILGKPKNNAAGYDMELIGKDDLGNNVEFTLDYMDGEGGGCFKISDPLNENAKSVALKPYAVKFPEKSGKLSHDFALVGEEFTIELDDGEE